MSFKDNIIIPKTPVQAANAANLIIREFGLNFVETNAYKQGIPRYAGRDQSLGYISDLGSPVFTNLVILPFTYTDPLTGKLITTKGFILDTVLMTISQQKNIVKTAIQGRQGTVKEYISDGDYQINIKIVLTGKNGKHPSDEVFDIKEILNAPTTIKLTSRWLQNLGIDLVVVESYTFPQKEGGYSYQAIDINCISDLPIELKLNV